MSSSFISKRCNKHEINVKESLKGSSHTGAHKNANVVYRLVTGETSAA